MVDPSGNTGTLPPNKICEETLPPTNVGEETLPPTNVGEETSSRLSPRREAYLAAAQIWSDLDLQQGRCVFVGLRCPSTHTQTHRLTSLMA
jgi:hypothetical protein